MPKFTVIVNISQSYTYDVEAEDELEARDTGEKLASQEFEHNGLTNPEEEVEDVFEDI